TDNENGKPDGIDREPFFGDRIANQIEQKKYADNQEEGVVFASGDRSPGKRKGGRPPAAEPGKKCRGFIGPLFKSGSEAPAQKRFLGEHNALVIKGIKAGNEQNQPPDMKFHDEAQGDEILAEVKRMTDDRIHAGGVQS